MMKRRKLSLESLESRRLLAGDVTVSLTRQGDLVIQGDSRSNQIVVERLADGRWEVSGDLGTTINRGVVPVAFTVLDDIIIDLRQGDDSLALFGLDDRILGDVDEVIVQMAQGHDEVFVQDLAARGNIKIDTHDGFDLVEVLDSATAADLYIQTGRHGDEVYLENVDVGDDLTISGKEGEDYFELLDVRVLDEVLLDTGNTRESDEIEVDGLEVGNRLTVSTGDGADLINATDVFVANDVRVDTGSGDDELSAGNVNIGRNFILKMGNGDDVAGLAGQVVAADLDGGLGFDELDAFGTVVTQVKIKRFENVLPPL